jgi:hypothetical protein
MSILTVERASVGDYDEIRRMHCENLRISLGEAGLADGFLTVDITIDDIDKANRDGAVLVARLEGGLAGYVFGTSCEYNQKFPLIRYALSLVDTDMLKLESRTKRPRYFYGPVCVRRDLRGRGVLLALNQALATIFSGRYGGGITFISKDNQRSLVAHTRKLGWKKHRSFEFGGHEYCLLESSP